MFKALRFFDEIPVHDSPQPVGKALSFSLYFTVALTAFLVRPPWGLILFFFLILRGAIVRAKSSVSASAGWIFSAVVFIGIPILSRGNLANFDYLGSTLALVVLLESTRLKKSSDARYLLILLILLSSAFPLAIASPWMSVMSMLLLILNIGCLLRLHSRGLTWEDLLGSAKMFFLALAYAVPMMLLFYVLLQHATRKNGGFGHGTGHEIGFTTDLSPGDVENLVERSETAYRVKTQPELGGVNYWRVATLERSRGLEWDRPDFEEGHLGEDDVPANCRLFQEVTAVGEAETGYPLALDPQINLLSLYTQGNAAAMATAAGGKVASSVCPVIKSVGAPVALLDPKIREKDLKIDFIPTDRVQELVKKITAVSKSPTQIIQNTLGYFLSGNFKLTLQPKSLTRGARGLNDFLFHSREGFCEHYAAALASLLRVAGVPARVVVGYKGGVHNPVGDYWRIAYSNAHAWAEAWDGSSWVRLDPTAFLPPATEPSNIWSRSMDKIWLLSDGVAFIGWQYVAVWVVLWNAWKWRVISGGCFLMAGLFLFFYRREKSSTLTRFEKSFSRLCKRLSKMGLRRNPAEGFEAFRVRLRNSLAADPSLGLSPESACVIDQTFEAYVQLRYGKNPPNADNIAKLVSNLRKIRLV